MAEEMLWQELYHAAMLELDRASLRTRIEAARVTIRQAIEDPTVNENREAMVEALRNLQTLERVELQRSAPSGHLPIPLTRSEA